MSKYLGDFADNAIVPLGAFTTNAADGGRESFSAGLEEADIAIYSDDGDGTWSLMTLDASTIIITENPNSKVGVYLVAVDMGNDADFTTGKDYIAVLYPDETVDSQSVAAVLGHWSCENRSVQNVRSLSFTGGNVHSRVIQMADDTIGEDTMTVGLKDLLQTLNTSGNNAVRDAILNRVLSGNHDTSGTPGGILQAVSLDTDIQTLLSRLTSSRAGYLDNLNVGGAVASQSDINAINQSASRRILLTTVGQYERPESGSTVYTIEARTFDGDGAATNADSTPTLTVTGQTTGDLSGNLSVASNPATGVYRWTYTVSSGATLEPIRADVSATMSTAFTLSVYTQVVDFVSATWTTSDAAKLTAISDKLPSKSYLAGTNNSDGDVQLDEATGSIPDNTSILAKLGTPAGASLAADVAAVKSDTTSLTSRITATLFQGITRLIDILGAIAAKHGNATARGEINASGDGSGTFHESTDSQEGSVDSGAGGLTQQNVRDSFLLAPTGGATVNAGSIDQKLNSLDTKVDGISTGSNPQLMLTTTIDTLASQTSFTLNDGSPNDNAYHDARAIIVDQVTAAQKDSVAIASYDGDTLTLTLETAPVFEIATGDTVYIVANTSGTTTLAVTPLSAGDVRRAAGTTLTAFEGETSSITVYAISDASGNTIDLTTYAALQVVIENYSGTVLQTIAHGALGLTAGGNCTFSPSATVTATVSTNREYHYWSLRDTNNGDQVLAQGRLNIVRVATDA